jgi:uracil DNA glycosylase
MDDREWVGWVWLDMSLGRLVPQVRVVGGAEWAKEGVLLLLQACVVLLTTASCHCGWPLLLTQVLPTTAGDCHCCCFLQGQAAQRA